MMYALVPYISVIVIGLAGFSLALYISRKKKKKQVMVCPLGSDCDAVIHSQYSRFLGIPVELLGLLYYTTVTITYLLFLFIPDIRTPLTATFALTLSSFAFLFSLYLIFIQAFVLKQWCTWCLTSAAFSTGIFLVATSSAILPNVDALTELHPLLSPLHILAVAIGVGAATISQIFLVKFLKDYRLSMAESDTLHTLSDVLWVALGLVIVTQVGLYFGNEAQTAQTVIKNITIFIIVFNGAFLHALLTPRLLQVSSGAKHDHTPGELHRLRHIALTLSAISIASWYFLVMLDTVLEDKPMTGLMLFAIYGSMFLAAGAINRLFDLIKKPHSEKHKAS